MNGMRTALQDAAPDTYDVIIVDSSDPIGPASVLFSKACRAVPTSQDSIL